MRNAMMILGLLAGAAAAGEPTPEAFLPLHENRDAYAPAAAFGKDVFLVVWQSGRIAEGDLRQGLNFNADIVGCRLDKAGKPLDAKPFVICGAKDLQEKPKVVFGGDSFLVVWQDMRNGKDWDVYAARVTPDGKVLDPDGILVAGGARSQAFPRAAWDGKAFQVVWQDIRSGAWEIYGARVGPDGKLLDSPGACLGPKRGGGYPHCHSPAVGPAVDGKNLLLWVSYREYGLAFLADGKMAAGGAKYQKADRSEAGPMTGHGPNAWASPIAVAAGPKSWLATWRTFRPVSRGSAPGKSQAALFGPDGTRTKNVSIGGGSVVDPDVAWDGTNFVVAWSEYVKEPYAKTPEYDVVRCSRITPEGEISGPVVALSGAANSPATLATVASDGAGTTLVAYERHPDKADVPIKIGVRILTK